MPANSAPKVIPRGARDGWGDPNLSLDVDKRNYDLGEDPNGYANATNDLARRNSADQMRGGPRIDTRQSGDLGQVAQQSRGEENLIADALRAQAYGTGYNPAIAQRQATTHEAQAMQQSLAASQGGYGLGAARREAAWQGAALAGQGAQQDRLLQAQMMQFGRDQYGQFGEAIRGQDLASREAMQQEAQRQAALEDAQRTQNDAMSQFYLGEGDRLRHAQTQANINYEAQDAANKLGQSNLQYGRDAFNTAQYNQNMAATLGAVGTAAAGMAAYSTPTDPNGGKQMRRDPTNPYDPGY